MQTVQENILDVALLELQERHAIVFARFYALKEGESLIIESDHDPKPLYYQLLSEGGDPLGWKYLETGPRYWKVQISKNIAGTGEETVGEIAAKDLRKAQIFKKYGLDFCCGGKKTVKQACLDKGLDAATIEHELQQADENFNLRPLPYNEWNLDFLADYIVNTHHSYVRKSIPLLLEYAAKVSKAHGGAHSELPVIRELIEEIGLELSAHMMKEEQVLFPYIKKLAVAASNAQPLPATHFGTVKNPVRMMELEHEMAAQNLEKIKALSNNYTLPANACGSYSFLYRMLKEFEDDLHIHVHLENNILFPKAIELEKTLNGEACDPGNNACFVR